MYKSLLSATFATSAGSNCLDSTARARNGDLLNPSQRIIQARYNTYYE